MFEVGFWEMVLIGIVGLLVFGPERLPRVARETALWVRKARSMVSSIKEEIDHELQVQELRESLDKQRKSLGPVTLDGVSENLLAPTGNPSGRRGEGGVSGPPADASDGKNADDG